MTYYDSGLTPWHTEINWDPDMRISVNEAPVTACWFDWESYNDYHWVWLHFEYRPLSYYIWIGKVRVWIS